MARLTSKERNALPDSAFALPKQRKYPINDPSHQRNAKARASGQEHEGNISKSTEEKIFRKADAKLKHHHDGHMGHSGHGEVDGMKGHKGHTGDGKMEHMSVHMASPQNKKHIMKHGGKLGQHPYGGTNSGNHTFHSIKHPDHHSKMVEG